MFRSVFQLLGIQVEDSASVARIDDRFVVYPVGVSKIDSFLRENPKIRSVALDTGDSAVPVVEESKENRRSVGAEFRRVDVVVEELFVGNVDVLDFFRAFALEIGHLHLAQHESRRVDFAAGKDNRFAAWRNVRIDGVGEDRRLGVTAVCVGNGNVEVGVSVSVSLCVGRVGENRSCSRNFPNGNAFVKPGLFRLE